MRLIVLFMFSTVMPAWADDVPLAAVKSPQEILDCAAANSSADSFRHELIFTSKGREGGERVMTTRILGQRGAEGLRLNLRVTDPPATAKTTILVREREGQDDMRIFLPAANRTQQVTGGMAATKLLGTDFSYNDLKQMFGAMLDGEVESRGEAEIAGRAVDRLRLLPSPEEETPYDEVIVAFDRQTCVPLLAEFKTTNGQVLRTLTADVESLSNTDSRHYARIFTLADLVSETQTRVEFSLVQYDQEVPGRAFHPLSFKDVD